MDRLLVALVVALLAPSLTAQNLPLDQRFAYQGELRDNGVIVDGTADFQFSFYDQPAAGNQIGTTQSVSNVPVVGGVFTVDVPFSEAFTFAGDKRFMEISVRNPAGVGSYTPMNPRVELLPTPNAHYARLAAQAFNANTLGGKSLGDLVQKGEAGSVTSGMIPAGGITNTEIAFATITESKIVPDIVSSIDGVTNDGGDINLIAGSNITITPNDAANTITISAIANSGADTLDGLDSTQFLRSDAVDVFSGPLLQVSPTSILDVDGTLNLDGIVFAKDGGSIDVLGSPASFSISGTNLDLELDAATTEMTGAASIQDDLTVGGDVNVDGTLNVGTSTTTQLPYNKFGATSTPGSSDISNANDLFVGSDIEVGQTLYLSGQIRMDSAEGDQSVYFYDSGSTTNEFMRWADADDRFRFSDDVSVSGTLSTDSDLYINAAGPDADSHVYFHANGSPTGESLSWDEAADRFVLSDHLLVGTTEIGGVVKADYLHARQRIRLNPDGPDASSFIYFHDNNDWSANSIEWSDDGNAVGGCTASSQPDFDSYFRWNIDDGTDTGWVFTIDNDVECAIDEEGNLWVDKTFQSNGACDLAETFLGPELEAATLVRADLANPEAVEPTNRRYDAALIGVVSTLPGVLLRGPTADAYPVYAEFDAVKEALRGDPENEALQLERDNLEIALDSWPRGDVPVALAGRVPVKVVGPVLAGEPLTSSDVEGYAMAMRRAGPSVGIALESKAGAGRGTVLVLVQPGWREPRIMDEVEREDAALADGRDSGLEARVEALEARTDRQDGRDGRDGATGGEGRTIVRIERQVWGDVDGDGRDDVVLLSPGGDARLHRNLGGGRFEDVTDDARLGAMAAIHDARLEDADRDGTLDLVFIDADGHATVLAGNGAFGFTDVTHHVEPPATASTDVRSEIDALKAQLAELKAMLEGRDR